MPSSSMSILAPVSSWSPDRLAARADEQADLLGIDLDLDQPRSIGRDLLARPLDRAEHRPQDLAPGLAGLLERLADDLLGDAVDLQVELDAGDAALVPATLKSMSPK